MPTAAHSSPVDAERALVLSPGESACSSSGLSPSSSSSREAGDVKGKSLRRTSLKRFNSLRDIDSKWAQEEILKNCNAFDYDIFATTKIIGKGAVLNILGDALMIKLMDYPRYLHVDSNDLKQFLTIMQDGYHSENPYHNAIHATDVMQTSCKF